MAEIKEPKITVIFVPVEGRPEVKKIQNHFKAFQELVGGYFETTRLFVGGEIFVAVVDDEGKLKNLEPNFLGHGGDVLVGPVVITKSDSKGEFVSLDEKDIAQILARIEPEKDARRYNPDHPHCRECICAGCIYFHHNHAGGDCLEACFECDGESHSDWCGMFEPLEGAEGE